MNGLRYAIRLLCALDWRTSLPGRRSAVLFAGAVMLLGGSVYSGADIVAAESSSVDVLQQRAAHVSTLLDRVEQVYEEQVAPIERVLLRYRANDPDLVRRVAVSLVREARATELEPRLLLAVLLVENPWIDPAARSPVGAQGLMQVMPFHRGNWKQCAPRLDDVESNICHGAHIFAAYLRSEKGNIDRALLRYNGCVRGTNTPDCHQYPNHVYARAGRASVLAWYGGSQGTMAASR